ncbi:MAG: thioredoxin family protein [Prevotella sp.]|nr:thioredoxin family protein [Prevotella sp.]
MKKPLTILLLLLAVITAAAQMQDPVHFRSELKTISDTEAELLFSATIDAGWHVYSTGLGNDGPISATFHADKMEGAKTVGALKARGKEQKVFDKMFDMEVRYFENAVTFVQKIQFTKPQYDIECYVEYGACNDQMCMPPSTIELKASGKAPVKTEPTPIPSQKEGGTEADHGDGSHDPVSEGNGITENRPHDPALWQPVVSELRAMNTGTDNIADHSLLYILLMGFVGGLLAVLMPCIWPIIPMTVSFFLKRAKTDKAKGIRDALTYGASIIVIYLALGLLVTAIFGSDTLNAMSTNAFFNIFLFLLLVVFALSFFGWFEIKLPDSWATKVDQKSDELSSKAKANSKLSSLNSQLSIFLMAFTLVLVSFSCTAPIIGLLLVETTTSGNWLAPAMGMLGFAIALALPFTLFALFPSWLKQAPKSGGWMNIIKVVLGFIELAFALKFFSVADLAYGWHLLDREVFLALWIAIFTLLGLYLMGVFRFQSDVVEGEEQRPMPVACIMGGLISLAFAIYMVPGLWGAPCKAVSAFAPPISTQDFNLNSKTVEARFTDYEQGMAAAKAEGKPVLIDFTGFGCVNCRKMEAAVWTDPQVADLLEKKYVLISLYVDDKTPLAEPIEVTDTQGQRRTLRTVGAKWSYLQSHKFGANAQPFYVILNNEGHPLMGSRSYDEDVDAYIDFLRQGIRRYAE